VTLAREAGALTMLPFALTVHAGFHLFAGEFADAEVLREEARGVSAAMGYPEVIYHRLALAGWRGQQAETSKLIEAGARDAAARGEGRAIAAGEHAAALLYNGLGRYEDALLAAQQAGEHPEDMVYSTWGLVELIEAATRSGKADLAADALERLSQTTRPSGTEWALGIEANSRALLSDGQAAENLYREAIDRLARTRIATYHARAHLLYGEWLRRERRRLDARELLATGETARKRTVETSGQLTAQETQIARLARAGLSNPEIGAQLFISPRTVEYHLHKVFAKLDISSRNQLGRVLPSDSNAAHAV
jgi:DNA-binding CsgD family transcriptional regulator